MKFGLFYEHQLPKPWTEGAEQRLFHEALEQAELADKLGLDHLWQAEHHFLEEYSHSSAPEIFLAACSQRTKNIRIGHGVRLMPSGYNHPARVAEQIGTLDIMSNGRVEWGTGESASRTELDGYGVPLAEKRAQWRENVEQAANMMAMSPYPGYKGGSFSLPCRNIVPKPVQKPHPPMWMACTNRDTIKVAASIGVGALAFSFLDPEEARGWADIYYGIIKSDQCTPIGHSVNANIAMVSNFSVHHDRAEAIRRGQEGFEFFGYAVNALVAHDVIPGRSTLFADFQRARGNRDEEIIAASRMAETLASGIGTPGDIRAHLKAFQNAGVDQVIFLQQAGRNKHAHICEALELFAAEVMGEFKADVAEREARKAEMLAPHIEAALARKKRMAPLREDEIPVVKASVKKAEVNEVR